MTDSLFPYSAALGAYYGDAYVSLPADHRAALMLDLRLMVQDGDALTALRAVDELDRRIGGTENLRAYSDCIVVEYRRGKLGQVTP